MSNAIGVVIAVVLVTGASFKEGVANEVPVHRVCLTKAFEVDVHEVTNAEYGACVVAKRCSAPGGPSSKLELPEVLNLSRQLDKELKGRTIASAGRGNSPHKFAFFKPSEEDIASTLAGKEVTAVRGDGKYITFDLKPKALFSIAEMDGRILFHEKGAELPAKHQLLVRFTDGAALTATVGLWGFFGILPTREVRSLDRGERKRLHRAVRGVLAEATRKGGSANTCDIYGRPGRYVKAVGAKVKTCVACRTPIAKRSFLGGATYYCPRCQK